MIDDNYYRLAVTITNWSFSVTKQVYWALYGSLGCCLLESCDHAAFLLTIGWKLLASY